MLNTSLSDLKKELYHLAKNELIELCVHLMKYKKENKELVDFLLFHTKNEQQFIEDIKSEMNFLFEQVNNNSVFLAKKTLRKIIRINTKYLNFSKNPIVAIEVCAYFCRQMNSMKLNYGKSQLLSNMYMSHIKKIEKNILSLHEDLQYDYQRLVEELMKACRN